MSIAVVVENQGGPEALKVTEVTVGEPGPGQVRIVQTAIGLNFIDTYQRSGLYPIETPFVAGNEGVGTITAVGPDVESFKPGDRVTYNGSLGAYARDRLLPVEKVIPVPDGIDDREVAAMMLKGMTAYYLLFKTWPLKAGETILYHAAAGGVGLLACQWAKAIGARVIGTVGSADKAELALENGCDEVINYREENFVERVRDLTDGKGVDVVYDGVGKDTFESSLDCLRPRGLMVSFGNASGVVSIPDLGVLARKGSLYVTRPTAASYFANREDMLEGAAALFDAVKSEAIKVNVNHTFRLEEAAEAHRALEARETTGSVVLLP
ncbi:quinone oxidoreductase [Devosia pacifica]|uniref:Quinone oxidoreductase n=1 Tax=Devosia pacifica TaxID=1335967 RepID=A0A918RW41_9HYPH|nr:quinone oxidoreductase [Devosia pacifica]GHA11497.1 quinone oxidoreductase [Devosia pacifica]